MRSVHTSLIHSLPAIMLIIACLAPCTYAEWAVELESKSVPMGATDVTMDITGWWDQPISAFVLPIVVREIDPGSFWTGMLPYDTNGQAGNHPYAHGVTWSWGQQWATFLEVLRPGIGKDRAIWCDPPADTLYNAVSPDNFAMAAAKGIGDDPLPAQQNKVIITLTFDVTANPGQFEFDTACFLVGQTRFAFVDRFGFTHGDRFTKGIITITGCVCPDQGDCNGDGFLNAADLVLMVNHALLDQLPVPLQGPDCPVSTADWNCDGRVNIIDIGRMAGYLFRWPRRPPCDPCE